MISEAEFAAATDAGKALNGTCSPATSVHYDHERQQVLIGFGNSLVLSFSPAEVEGLDHATPAELAVVELASAGYGIHFPRLDADIYIPGLLQGITGSQRWMVARADRAIKNVA